MVWRKIMQRLFFCSITTTSQCVQKLFIGQLQVFGGNIMWFSSQENHLLFATKWQTAAADFQSGISNNENNIVLRYGGEANFACVAEKIFSGWNGKVWHEVWNFSIILYFCYQRFITKRWKKSEKIRLAEFLKFLLCLILFPFRRNNWQNATV